MRRGTIALPATFAIAAAAAGLWTLGAASSTPAAEASASIAWEPVAPKAVETNDDVIGAFLWAGDVRYRIHYLEWGITFDGEIGYATLLAEGQDGSFIDYHHPEAYAKVVTTPNELVGTFLTDGSDHARYRIETVQYVVHSDGHLGIHSWSGTGEDGAHVALNVGVPFAPSADGPPCCGLRASAVCNSVDCSAFCPGPTNCACQTDDGKFAQGTCKLTDESVCSGNCDEQCKTIEGQCNGSVSNCACAVVDEPPPDDGGDGDGTDG